MKRKENLGLVIAIVVMLLLLVARVIIDINCKNNHELDVKCDTSSHTEVYDLGTDTYKVK